MKTRLCLVPVLALGVSFLTAALAAAEFASVPNTLSAAEKADGWRLLFDGKAPKGWRGYRKKEFPKQGWVIEEGCLKKVAGVNGGDIVTEAEFEDFELSWEWKLPPKANNGIKYLVLESRPGAPGQEYQMIDDSLVKNPLQKTASFYEVLPPGPNAKPKPMGEWNSSRIVVRGNQVEHWLNGERVLAYELSSPEVKAGVAKSKFKDAPGFGEKCRGRIMLTDHHDEASYRNLKLREFPVERR
jgi:hypothetical protein